MEYKKLDMGQGMAWYGCGWNFFKQGASVWVLTAIVFLVIGFACSLIPAIGPMVFMLLVPLLISGFYFGADDIRQGRSVQMGTLFQAFFDDEARTPLLILGGLFLGLMIAFALIVMLMVGPGMMSMGPASDDIAPRHLLPRGLGMGFVVMMLVQVLIAMCMFFAVPLTAFDKVAPVEAIKTSFQATVRNILPFLLFIIVYIVLAFIASIPFFLGFIVLLPIAFCSIYCAYRGVFK